MSPKKVIFLLTPSLFIRWGREGVKEEWLFCPTHEQKSDMLLSIWPIAKGKIRLLVVKL